MRVSQRHTGALTVLVAVGVLTALLFGSVTATAAPATAAPATAAPANWASRANAVRTAKDYLRTQGFSYKGLVEQLEYEGYSASDSKYGARHSGANWYRQAVRTAKDYLRTQPFSFRGLVEQLQYEGYTRAQAVYGAHRAGL